MSSRRQDIESKAATPIGQAKERVESGDEVTSSGVVAATKTDSISPNDIANYRELQISKIRATGNLTLLAHAIRVAGKRNPVSR